jgi:hypothetical protein
VRIVIMQRQEIICPVNVAAEVWLIRRQNAKNANASLSAETKNFKFESKKKKKKPWTKNI